MSDPKPINADIGLAAQKEALKAGLLKAPAPGNAEALKQAVKVIFADTGYDYIAKNESRLSGFVQDYKPQLLVTKEGNVAGLAFEKPDIFHEYDPIETRPYDFNVIAVGGNTIKFDKQGVTLIDPKTGQAAGNRVNQVGGNMRAIVVMGIPAKPDQLVDVVYDDPVGYIKGQGTRSATKHSELHLVEGARLDFSNSRTSDIRHYVNAVAPGVYDTVIKINAEDKETFLKLDDYIDIRNNKLGQLLPEKQALTIQVVGEKGTYDLPYHQLRSAQSRVEYLGDSVEEAAKNTLSKKSPAMGMPSGNFIKPGAMPSEEQPLTVRTYESNELDAFKKDLKNYLDDPNKGNMLFKIKTDKDTVTLPTEKRLLGAVNSMVQYLGADLNKVASEYRAKEPAEELSPSQSPLPNIPNAANASGNRGLPGR